MLLRLLQKLLTKHTRSPSFVFMGDFNINLLNSDSHAFTVDFINTLSSYCFQPHILHPTCITRHSATLRSCSIGKNRFRLVWLINFFNRHQTRLKRLKKHWHQPLSFTWAIESRPWAPAVLLSGLNLSTLRSLVITFPRSYHVSTESGWKSVLLGNFNCFN